MQKYRRLLGKYATDNGRKRSGLASAPPFAVLEGANQTQDWNFMPEELERICKDMATIQSFALAALTMQQALAVHWAFKQRNPQRYLSSLFEMASRMIENLNAARV
jgi:hypothetical protein